MKKILLAAFILMAYTSNSQIKMPAPSPTQTINQDFGLGKMEITYSRPSIKGRKVFKENSELAPFGKIWRTGANSATKFKVTDPIEIGGNKLDTGTYALYTIPNKGEWTIIINKGTKNWGASQYDQANDIFRTNVKTSKGNDVETFTIQFADIKAETCNLQLLWSNTVVNIPIASNIKERIKVQVEKTLAADSVSSNAYFTAANFYYDMDKDYSKALQNVVKAIDGKTDKFWQWLLKAKIEKELGDKVSAKASAEACIKSATEQKNDDYVRGATELIKTL